MRPGRAHARPVVPCCGRAPDRVVTWPGRVAGPGSRVAARKRAPLALCRGHLVIQCLTSCFPLVTIHYCVLRYNPPQQPGSSCHDTIKCIVTRLSQPSQLACHDTPPCIATQPSQPLKPISVTIQNLYCDTAFTHAKLAFLSRYTWCIATQLLANKPLPVTIKPNVS